MNYAAAKSFYETARDPSKGKPFPRRCRADARVVKTRKGYGVQVYSTVVVEWLPSGIVILNSGGWKTPTTRDWINASLKDFPHKGFSTSIYQRDFVWYVGRYNYKTHKHREFCEFFNNMVLQKDGIPCTAKG